MKKLILLTPFLFLAGCFEYVDTGYYNPSYTYGSYGCQSVDYGYMVTDCNGGTYYKNSGSYISPTYRQNSYGEVYTSDSSGNWSRNRSLE